MAFTPDDIAQPGIPLLGCSPPSTTMRYRTVFGGSCMHDSCMHLFTYKMSQNGGGRVCECMHARAIYSVPKTQFNIHVLCGCPVYACMHILHYVFLYACVHVRA